MKIQNISKFFALATLLIIMVACGNEENITNGDKSIENFQSNAYNYPSDRMYSDNHEWIKIDPDGKATVGITYDGLDGIGDVVGLGNAGDFDDDIIRKKKRKTLKEILTGTGGTKPFTYPVGGAAVQSNPNAILTPIIISQFPMSTGWLFRLDSLEMGDFDSLMTAQQYMNFVNPN